MQGPLKGAAVTLGVGRLRALQRAPLPDRPPYPTRLRAILIFSIFSWMIIALIIAWAIRSW